jgi:hypothetical protein
MKLNRSAFSLSFTAVLGLCAFGAQAQELRLFEPTESEAQASPMTPDQVFAAPANGQPAYTLRSISRFGDRYQATLVNRAGETTSVSWRVGETAPVQNTGYTIVAASGGALSITHPGGDNCVAAPEVGVNCSAGDRSELRLTAAAPLASNGVNTSVGAMGPMGPPGTLPANDPLGIAGVQPQQGVMFNEAGQQVFINPFSGQPEVLPQISEEERLAREQRQQQRAARLRQFQQGPQTIPDQAVPPGMERVRTPFGDTLIPQRR